MRRIGAVALLGGVLAVLLGSGAPASAADSAATDQVQRFDARYEIRPDGVVVATETIEFATGSSSLVRRFRVRGPDDVVESKDRVFAVSKVAVTTVDGAKVKSWQERYDPLQNVDDYSYDSRYELLNVSVGSPAERRPERYVLRYEIRGALDQVGDGIRIRVPGLPSDVRTDAISATITAPSGVRSVSCTVAGHPCRQATVTKGIGRLRNAGGAETVRPAFDSSSDFTFTVGVAPGAVSGVGPVLEKPGLFVGMTDVQKGMLIIALIVAVPALVITLTVVAVVRAIRRNRRATA
ncbi:hypothetical protein FB561_2109 [Kribbella amoyensis]|uniref:DUF2207 domain-containing protein n=1 Tax=Kribbella amoyensis TaxID=996641 RepID=A0A561BQ87_9ACTN|nr:DUF2207 domain-containing protein [Kribbella amoyensis]TWD81007.1 hypothetical protein FB561_2109 [Kribbella amoyensis]